MPKALKIFNLRLAFTAKKDKKAKKEPMEKMNANVDHNNCVICREPLKSKKQEDKNTFYCPICRTNAERLMDDRTRTCFSLDGLFKRRQMIVPTNNSLLTGRVIAIDEAAEQARLDAIEARYGPLGDELLSVREFLMERNCYLSNPSLTNKADV